MNDQVIQDAHPDVLSLLRARAALHPDTIAIEAEGKPSLSYSRLLARSEQVAKALSRLVPGKRPRVGLVIANGPDMSVALLGASVVGVALPFNPQYKAVEFESYFDDTKIDVLVTAGAAGQTAVDVAKSRTIPLVTLDALEMDSTAAANTLSLPNPDDVAMILLTSGSTGRPKKVPLTHRNICVSARDVSRSIGLSSHDRCLSMWEQFHVGGLVDLLLAPLHSGGTIIATAGFDASVFFRLLASAKPTWWQGVPATLGELQFHAQRHKLATTPNSLRLVRSVAAALSPALMADIEALFGVPVITTFGMTEAGPLITSTRLPPAQRKPGSVGTSAGPEIAVFDGAFNALPSGQQGIVAVRGPNVFSGYEADAEANAAAFRNGWFQTGDTGYIDPEGHLFLTGRVKEMINRGGEKVNPREVDDAMLTHPAVAEAASFAITHKTLGEDVAAAVVVKPGMSLNDATLRAHLNERLVAFKVPRRIDFVPSLPRNAVGKIDRIALAKAAADRPMPDASSEEGKTETEQKLAAIWAHELNVKHVGPEDDFFALGGDSLSGLRLFFAVESAFGVEMPADALTRLTTVRAMADELSRASAAIVEADNDPNELTAKQRREIIAVMGMGTLPAARPGSPIKLMNGEGKRKPIIWCFNSPATEMLRLGEFMSKDQPIYGAFTGGKIFERDDDTLWKIARLNVREMLELLPDGPFIVGGNCQGGRVGWMMTQLLEQAGKKVEAQIFLEFSAPELAKFHGPQLLMFGEQSIRRHYRYMGWGKKDWDKPFPVKPIVSWVTGSHGGFFREDTISSFVAKMESFLAGKPDLSGTLDNARARRVMALHKLTPVFLTYRMGYKIYARLRYGPKVKYNPFTGEAMT